MSKPLPNREARNGHDTVGLYLLLGTALIVLAALFLFVLIAFSGCSELATYSRQHGWN